MNMFDLKGKVAVITGGNGGIGLGMARGIASCGASIVIAGRDEPAGIVRRQRARADDPSR